MGEVEKNVYWILNRFTRDSYFEWGGTDSTLLSGREVILHVLSFLLVPGYTLFKGGEGGVNVFSDEARIKFLKFTELYFKNQNSMIFFL